ncbi:CHY zinc finger domain-containing protein [Spironucleus salmonicida]|uniref:CHY zinc finger domain-containing protein n=1 Tax=Spironucleus salmonicida TaxID=348837 RepID=A0A9P8LTT6_9EUKA|nr:CHY zinc finger domain-containing protein [Spironucleus salmonicida]
MKGKLFQRILYVVGNPALPYYAKSNKVILVILQLAVPHDYQCLKYPQPAFPLALFKPSMSVIQLEESFLQSTTYQPAWLDRADPVSVIYEEQQVLESTSCEHVSSSCELVCATCKNVYRCRFCHDAEEAHQFQLESVRCAICHAVVHDTSCPCGAQLFRHMCQICSIYSLIPLPSHCNSCETCHFAALCPGGEACACCLEPVTASLKLLRATPCMHIVHEACAQKLNSFQCPVCRMAMLSGAEKHALLQEARKLNAGLLCPRVFDHFYCFDCSGTFPCAGPVGVCQRCRFTNSERRGSATSEEYQTYRLQFADFVELRRPLGLGAVLELLEYREMRCIVEEMLRQDIGGETLEALYDDINIQLFGRDGNDDSSEAYFDSEEEEEGDDVRT